MKKILITLFGLIALPVSATYYSSSDTYSSGSGKSTERASHQSNSVGASFQDWLSANEKYAGIDFSKTRNRYHSWQGAAPPVDDPQAAWEAYEREKLANGKKKHQKQSRNASYGHPGSKPAKRPKDKKGGGSNAGKGSYGRAKSDGSFGSRKDWGGSKGSKGKSHSRGSKGDYHAGSKGSHSGGSKGSSRPDKWLDKEDKREQQLETFKKILMHKLDKFPDWNGDKDSDWSKDFDKDFWSDKHLTRALLCWLAPHLHEDEKWVNRDWKKLKHKIWWWLKHHKHKFPNDKPDPPAQVPLPASVYLFGTALLGLGAIGRKRSKA